MGKLAGWLVVVVVVGVAALVLVGGCGNEVSCGPGTVKIGSSCVAEDGPGPGTTSFGDGGASGGDDGTTTGGGGGGGTTTGGGGGGGGGADGDAGPAFGTEPPVDGGSFGGPPGCDEAGGECDEWEDGIAEAFRARQEAAGCSAELVLDERVDRVAERHAQHQADVDRLDSSSPDGNLFEQIVDEGVRFMNAGALFSVTRLGAEDVVDRWATDPEKVGIMDRCGYMTGIGVRTSETGASYVTILIVKL